MATFDQHQQVVTTQYNADRVTINQQINRQATLRSVDPEVLAAAERQLAALPLETIPDPAPLPPGSRMPLRRNPLFIGRAADLRTLATVLKGGETAAIGQTAAALGLGGIGKTQLASEFVHRYGQFGSDIHVMLALRRSSRQVVVANKQLNGTDMIDELLGKRQRFADQP